MPAFEAIEILHSGRVAHLTMNRPEKFNSLTAAVGKEITAAVNQLAEDADTGVIVISGRGKHFCAGGDINRMKELVDTKTYITDESLSALDEMAFTIRSCPKPVIAMVHGTAAGGGCSLALACDFRVVTPKSKFGMAFINLGLPGDTGGIFLLNKLINPVQATKMMMTGELVDGTEAYRIGLASYLVEEDELETATCALAEKLAAKSASGFAAQKRIINKYFFGDDMQRYFLDERAEMVSASHCPDFSEAVYAFLEKRAPIMNKK